MMDIDASNILNKITPLRSNYHCHSLTLKSYFYISINAPKKIRQQQSIRGIKIIKINFIIFLLQH